MWKCLGWHVGFFLSSVYLVAILALNVIILSEVNENKVPNMILTGVAFAMEIPLYIVIGVAANRYFDKSADSAFNDLEKNSNESRRIRRSRRSRRHRI